MYRNVGTRDIAAAAGVNQTLINRYFGSKKELFTEVVLLSLRDTLLTAKSAKELEQEVFDDLLADEDNRRKEKLRLLLYSSMDSDVADVISEFFLRQTTVRGKFIAGTPKETKSFLVFSTMVGIAVNYSLLPQQGRDLLDKEFIKKHFSRILDEMYTGGEKDHPDLD